jgi:hypothetical protein
MTFRSEDKRKREAHAHHRSRQRLGVDLTDELRGRIVRAIKKRERWQKRINRVKGGFASTQFGLTWDGEPMGATLISVQAMGRQKWRICLDGMEPFKVIYAPQTKIIVTILT